MKFSFSDTARTECLTPGEEKRPVLIIDGVLDDPEALVALAGEMPLRKMGPYYPGIRAAMPTAFTESFCNAVFAVTQTPFMLTPGGLQGECFLSMVTTPPQDLQPIQRLPHFDGLEDNRLAAILYLGGTEFGGTALYRHKATGFETVNEERFPRFRAALEDGVRRNGLPPAEYMREGAPHFEKILEIDAKPNRMVIYNGNHLHSGNIRQAEQLTADPGKGRLTLNGFLSNLP